MKLLDIKKVILEVAGEKLSKRTSIDGIENKLLICKESAYYLEYLIKLRNKAESFSNPMSDDVLISSEFANLLKQKIREQDEINAKEFGALKEKINDDCYQDAMLEYRKCLSQNRVNKAKIDKKELIEALIKLDESDLISLNLNKEEINLLLKVKLIFHNLNEELEALNSNAFVGNNSYLNNEEIEILRNLCTKIEFVNPNILKQLQLDIILFDSYIGNSLITDKKHCFIDSFLLNNRNLILYDKEIMDEVNKRIGFNFIINNEELKKFYNMFLDPTEYVDDKYNIGTPGLNLLLNKLSLLSKAYLADSYGFIDKIKKIYLEVSEEFNDMLSLKILNDFYTNNIYVSNDFNKNDSDIFNLLYTYDELIKDKDINGLPNKNSIILNELLNEEGVFKGLTDKEIADIIVSYFAFGDKTLILSNDPKVAFKDLSPLVNEIISNRETNRDVIGEFVNNDYLFSEVENKMINNI